MTIHTSPNLSTEVPLVVDLDGTLIRSDMLLESAIRLVRRNPLYVFLIFLWLCQGKRQLKTQIAQRVEIPCALLPYHLEFLSYLQEQFRAHRKLVLATATDMRYAQQIAAHLGIFSDVWGTTAERNLAGEEKAKVLLQAYGEKGFDYAGNATPDLKIWQHARRAIVVNASAGLEQKARSIAEISHVFSSPKNVVKSVLKAIRVYQWVKNLLIFVPLFVAHQWYQTTAIYFSAMAFVAFSLCASAIYLINDLLDLDSDRAHKSKRNRPIASGNLSILTAVFLVFVLLLVGLLVAQLVSNEFCLILGTYLILTSAYSFYLKRIVLMDVLLLAFLYTIRVIAGAIAIQVEPSFWLLAFSMLIFTSLALIKRCAELKSLKSQEKHAAHGRDYVVSDIPQLTSLGTAAGYGAVVILALYINSPDVARHYQHPKFLWLLCPLCLYWIGRMWITTGRGLMHDDPIVYAAKDKVSLVIGALGVAMVLFAL
ncbi:UbiA family prenyltransferase [Undibacterium seohonense]|uniref:UbiA family prenyltransferase n=1 Tax=Undibacterium seohonense TaxID=1344950 RepID=A0ABR6X381_9BURK|nr:UbiA family prenyltransferase [Undibacterium seohonense]MBC3807010.1 UbiA family prenyltransferase [Undibacterium seohonense]